MGCFFGRPFLELFRHLSAEFERKKHQKLSKTTGFEHISNLGCFLGGPFWNISGEGKRQPLGAKALKTLVL